MTTVVEGFEIVEPIGSGGFSRVYRAKQLGFDRDVALKVLTLDVDTPVQRLAFERECRAMGALAHHPSIVSVFTAAYSADGRPCIAMEYFAGGTLGDRVKKHGPLELDAVLRAGVELAGALHTAHEQGVIHRDIKPSNLFVSAFGGCALGDFGISSFDDERTITGCGGLTVHYAPPELIDGEPSSVASDLYSLAGSLYTLADGDKPYPKGPGQTTADLARRILIEPTPRLGRLDAPAELVELLQQTMAKRPEERPATAADFGRRLQAIQDLLGLSITPLVAAGFDAGDGAASPKRSHGSDPIGIESSPWHAPGNRRLTAAALGALSVIALASTAVAVRGSGADGDDQPTTSATVVALPTDEFFAAPSTPSGVSVTESGDGQVTVAWDSDTSGRAVSYEVQPTGTGEALSTVETSLTIDGGSSLCVVVRAVGERGRLSADTGPVCVGD